jgi:hypothetical protein
MFDDIDVSGVMPVYVNPLNETVSNDDEIS